DNDVTFKVCLEHWHDLSDLASQTAELIADPERRSSMSIAARERALDFGVEAFGRRVDELLEERTTEG
ncbi:MAG: hypothetical protein VW708_04015, partial [Ilumatobacter sp.]